MNHEGYKDPTAERAIRAANKQPKYVRDVIHVLRVVASLVGFRITELRLEDRKTGKEY